MVKTIISDLGGVFLTRGIWIFRDYLEQKYNIPLKASEEIFLRYYKQYFSGKVTEKEFWNLFLEELNIKEDWKKLREKLLNYFKPQEGIIELYSQLRQNGYQLILLSDQTKEWWPQLNKKHKIDSFFDHIIISALLEVHKPEPEIYKIALKKAKVKAEECIFIDDLKKNLAPAKKLGINTILFENVEQLKKELEKKEINF